MRKMKMKNICQCFKRDNSLGVAAFPKEAPRGGPLSSASGGHFFGECEPHSAAITLHM